MTPFFSVIIPIYNAEHYLRSCLDSVLAQDTRSEYEVILVDDGSTDSSGAICDEYAVAHSRFRVLHTENQWVSAARNNGLRIAKGRYVLFLDADDLWSADLLSTLDVLAEKGPDVISFSACVFQERPEEKREVHQQILPSGESGEAWLEKLFHISVYPLPAPWIYGYRRAFLEKARLLFRPDLRAAEDLDFNMRCLPQAASVLGTNRVLYNYRVVEGSQSHAAQTPKQVMSRLKVNEWIFRKYPNEATANEYCRNALMLYMLGEREKQRDAIDFIKNNWDIWRYASHPPYRLGLFLFRILGCHNGSIVYRVLGDFWHKHGKPDTMGGKR